MIFQVAKYFSHTTNLYINEVYSVKRAYDLVLYWHSPKITYIHMTGYLMLPTN